MTKRRALDRIRKLDAISEPPDRRREQASENAESSDLAPSEAGDEATVFRRDRAVAIRRVLWTTLLLNLSVAATKLVYGYAANALAIRADGFHSLTDSSNNIVGLIAISLASRPADPGHPYGHQKFEILAAAFVGLSLLLTAVEVLKSAVGRLTGAASEAIPELGPGAYVVLLSTLAVNLGVSAYERRQGKKLNSGLLQSDSAHTAADAVVTLGVLVTVVLIGFGFSFLDIVAAVVIAGFIAKAGISVLKQNLGYLADTALLPPESIENVALTIPGVVSTHKVRTRGTPASIQVDLHIQIDRRFDVVDAHRVTHEVADAIKREFPDVIDVLIHTEPAEASGD